MAYALRYYKELIHEDGSVHRLEIHKKDSTAEAVEIGAVIQELALEIQGSQGDVDSPIVKTSLSMTFVDAGDIEDGRKNGFWQEFYTPDALLWKVILKVRTATETSFRTMWGGYVTPDSFSESLVYRGSVNIIARDNLGHMQDFPFDAVGDADGLISLRNLVEAGWEKIQSPMVLDWRGEVESNMWLMCDGVPAPDTLMNVSQFEGMDWYKAIETALASYGIVMRYVGDNIVNVSSLRSMPLQGREVMDNLSQITPVFVAGAQRELVPAVRRIEESVSYDLQETLSMPKLDSSAFTGDTQSYRCKIDGVDIGYGQFGTLEHDAPIWPINPNNGWSDEDDATTLFFNPKAYELGTFASRRGLGDEIYRYMYIAANNVDDRRVSFTRSITCADVTISMKLGQPCNLDILSRIEQQSVFNLKRITFAVILEQGGVTRYYNGRSWGASYAEISVDYDPTSPSYEFSQFVSMDDNAGAAELTFCIVKIEYAQTSYVGNSSVYGLYACIQDLSFNIPESSSLLSDNSVNTVYNSENNVILSRTPEIGPAYNVVALPGLIKNGIFYRSEGVILPARAWGWSGSTPQQMAVYNHLQLLCYYAKPNNLISGTIVNGDLTSGRAIYLWHGKEHLLVSGRYNLLNGMIEGAMLREFTRYGAMWGEVSETAFPDTEQDSTTNVEGGASSGGSSPTYTNTTTVNIGSGGGGGASYLNDLMDVNTDSVTNQSVLYYNGTEWVGRSLSAILNSYAKSADLLTLSNLLASMWSIDDDGNLVTDKQVIIKNNLIVEGDTSSGGEGGGSSVGIQGIVVNGVTYRDTNGDGLIDLGTIESGLAEITSEMITEALGYVPYNASNPNGYITASALGGYATQLWVEGKGYAVASSLGSLATKDSVAWSEITNVLTGGDEFNIIPSGHNGVFSFNHRAKDGGSGTITEYRMRNGGGSYAPVRALTFIAHGGTSSQFLKADGSVDSTSYLSTAGGTIGGDVHIKSSTTNPLAISSSSGVQSGTVWILNDTPKSWFGYDANGTIMYDYAHAATLGIATDGVPKFNNHTLLHSGNVGEYALFKKNITKLTSSDDLNNYYDSGYYGWSDSKNPINSIGDNASMLAIKGPRTNDAFQLVFARNTNDMHYRARRNATEWYPWRALAFTDSTVASAYKLVTSAGADAVTVDSNGSATIKGHLFNSAASTYYLGISTSAWAAVFTNIVRAESGKSLSLGANASNHIIINSSGNVTIGSSDKASEHKLWVDGITRFNNDAYLSNWAYLRTYLTDGTKHSLIGINNKDILYINEGTTIPTIIRGGNVLIGTPNNPGNKLYVNGDGRFEGPLASGGSLTVGGTITANGATINGDVRINGNLVVTGDTASGGTAESNVGGNLRVDYNAMWALINKTSITQAEMDAVGFTTEVVDNITIGAYSKIVGELGDNKYVYNYECRDIGGSVQLHIYFGDENIDTYERFYFERSDAGTWTLSFCEI